MLRKILLAAAVAAALSTVAIAQGYGPGAGGCAGAGPGAGCGNGPGWGGGPQGRGMRGSPLMTPEERAAHRDAMHSLKSIDECRAYVEQHRSAMQGRAKELGIEPGPGPRADMCERMAARGFFQ